MKRDEYGWRGWGRGGETKTQEQNVPQASHGVQKFGDLRVDDRATRQVPQRRQCAKSWKETINVIAGFTQDNVVGLLGEAAVLRSQQVHVRTFTLQSNWSRMRDAHAHLEFYTLHASITSSQNAARLFEVKLKVHPPQSGQPWKVTGTRSPVFHKASMCNCEATVGCKHIAKALMHSVLDLAGMGAKEECVPVEVHDQALRLVQEGMMQVTSSEARARNHLASEVLCPPEMASFIRWGYVSPNYSWSPVGCAWKRSGKTWKLSRRGG